MSLFTKRRKVIHQKREEDRKHSIENSKKFEKSMDDILKVCDILRNEHPEFESLEGEERVKLFSELFKEVHGTN